MVARLFLFLTNQNEMKQKQLCLIRIVILMMGMLMPLQKGIRVYASNPKVIKAEMGRILKENGELWGWGNDTYFPDDRYKSKYFPAPMMSNIKDYTTPGKCNYVLKNDGTLLGWGWEVGDGTKEERQEPVVIAINVSKIVSPGSLHKGYIKTDNSLWLWGYNDSGQLGNETSGSDAYRLAPIKIMDGVQDCILGFDYTFALKTDGTVWLWGANHFTLIDESSFTTPRTFNGYSNVKQIVGGSHSVFMLKNDNSYYVCSRKHQ